MAQKTTTTSNQGSSMDLAEIKQIVDLMAKNEISFFQLEREGASLQLRRGHDIDALKDLLASLPAGFGGGSQPHVVYGGAAPAQAALPAPASAPAPAAAAPAAPAKEEPSGPAITSPMVGTFYLASGPGEQPFVKVGQHVDANTTVCIIEAMKVMNEIKAETSGTIARVIAQDGKPVQYGQPLFQLR